MFTRTVDSFIYPLIHPLIRPLPYPVWLPDGELWLGRPDAICGGQVEDRGGRQMNGKEFEEGTRKGNSEEADRHQTRGGYGGVSETGEPHKIFDDNQSTTALLRTIVRPCAVVRCAPPSCCVL
eukprot:GHVU01068757.1.p2 GENE.GHVU01068757.1~~GHVU01068757.1.p2  ORF type:complete len:123 (-),score=5.67 GHVU01068757.1:1599-1967(-)